LPPQGIEHFVQDLFRPLRLSQARLCDADQQVAEGARIQDACVIDDNKAIC
jgi:hypothetical protein